MKIIHKDETSTAQEDPRIYTVRAGTPFKLVLPYTEMLSQASQGSINRWFQQRSKGNSKVYFNVKLIELFYANHTDVGSNQPVIAVKLHVLVRLGNNIVHEGIYESGRVKGEKFGMTFLVGSGQKFEEYFTRAVYKAMLISLDMAMQDIFRILPQMEGSENSHKTSKWGRGDMRRTHIHEYRVKQHYPFYSAKGKTGSERNFLLYSNPLKWRHDNNAQTSEPCPANPVSLCRVYRSTSSSAATTASLVSWPSI